MRWHALNPNTPPCAEKVRGNNMAFVYDHSANFGTRSRTPKQKPQTLRQWLVQHLAKEKAKTGKDMNEALANLAAVREGKANQ